MRSAYLLSLPVLVAILLGCAGESAQENASEEPVSKGLEIHEWGVFRTAADADMLNADLRAVWDDLPPFVYGQITGRELPKHWEPMLLKDKPIIFFHTPQAVTVDLRIEFTAGMAGVWWPGTLRPGLRDGRLAGDGPVNKPFNVLEWRLNLKEPRGVPNGKVPLQSVKKGHWIETLRAVKADDVYAHVGEDNLGQEHEKFVYYDGLGPAYKWADISVDKETVTVGNCATFPLFDLTVVDTRKSDKPRVARMARLDARSEKKALDFIAADPKTLSDTGVKNLTAQVKDAGLHEDEANSLAMLWKADFFETEGLTLFYRLPQAEYDRLLPLKVKPRPEKVVRVGFVVHPHCEPDFAEKVSGMITDLDSADFTVRQGAQQRLEKLGNAAYAHMVRLRDQTKSTEVKRRLDELIEKHDARAALRR